MIRLTRRRFLVGAAATAAGAAMLSRLLTRAPSVIQVRYRLRRLPSGEWSKPLRKADLLALVRKRVGKHPAPYRLKRDDGEWGPPRTLDEIIDRLRVVLPKVPVGTRYRIGADDGATWLLRKVEIDLSCTQDTQGTDAIDRIYCTVVSRWRGVENWGICNCKRVAGSSTWSQHAWCNAWDIHHDSAAVMREIADFLVANAVPLDVAEVIYDGRIWTRDRGWRAYGGVNPHTNHIHVSGYPLKTGIPPCAS
jgi:hypothetical protein